MFNLEIIKDEYRDYANWLLKTKLDTILGEASVSTPNTNTIVLDWNKDPFDIRLDIRLNKKEGWLYTCNKDMKTDYLQVFDFNIIAELDRMIKHLKDYLK